MRACPRNSFSLRSAESRESAASTTTSRGPPPRVRPLEFRLLASFSFLRKFLGAACLNRTYRTNRFLGPISPISPMSPIQVRDPKSNLTAPVRSDQIVIDGVQIVVHR